MSEHPEAQSSETGNAAGSESSAAENTAPAVANASSMRLRLNPNKDHKPDDYEDLQLDYSPAVFSSLERYLPPSMLNATRDDKAKFMGDIINKYMPLTDATRIQKLRTYRQRIIANYQPLHRELYTLNPTAFFVPSFLKAISDNTEQSFRRIISEPSPGIFIFQMLQPRLCELFLSEIDNIHKFVNETKFRIMRPNIMNKHGVVLDDFGFGMMLGKLMEGFIRPLSRVFFREIGSSLDSHHGFVLEFGKDKATDMGFHVDDSEVTLNVCLGKQFSGGELFFRGTRCEKHVHTSTLKDEFFGYAHVPGQAVLHRGRLRRGAKATSGHRVNLLLWCRSSVFRELKRYQNDFSSWCGECKREKNERQSSTVAAAKTELLSNEGASTT